MAANEQQDQRQQQRRRLTAPRAAPPLAERWRRRQTSDAAASAATDGGGGGFARNRLNEGGDVAASFRSADDGSGGSGGGDNPVSYFPDLVAQVSFLVAVLEDGAGLYLEHLKEGVDLLATRLAPAYFPAANVTAVTASVNGWFPAACPTSRFQVCQDVSASIGLYLNRPDPNDGANGTDPSSNQDGAAGAAQDPASMTEELLQFEAALDAAIADDQLQEAIEKIQSGSQPSVFIVTGSDDGTGGGEDDSGNDNGNVLTGETVGPASVAPSGQSGGGTAVADGVINNNEVSPTSAPGASGGGLSTGGIIGVVLIVMVSMLVVATLIKLRRVSSRPSGSRRGGKGKGGGGTKSSKGGMKKYDPKSASTLGIQSATDDGDCNYAHGGAGPTSQPRSTSATASSVGTKSVVGDLDHVLIPVADDGHESLLDLDFDYEREGRNVDGLVRQASAAAIAEASRGGGHEGGGGADDDDDDNSAIANLLVATRSSDLCLAPTQSSELLREETAGVVVVAAAAAAAASVEGAAKDAPVGTAAGTSPDRKDRLSVDAAMTDDGSVSAGSSGWSSNASPSTVESNSRSPRYSTAPNMAHAIKALRAGHRSSRKQLHHFASGGSEEETDENEELLLRRRGGGPGQAGGEVDRNAETDADDERDGSPVQGGGARSSGGLYSDTSLTPPPGGSAPSKRGSQLDEAILNGDWAAVGATAALMAASVSPEVGGRRKDRRTNPAPPSPGSISASRTAGHPDRAADLDRLIEAGDWEAVMVAAARYDLEGGHAGEDGSRSVRSQTSTQGSDAMDESMGSTMDHSSVDRTVGRSVQTSASHLERVQEIRTQVEAMVRDVVPDEVENVDEMMAQFKGKEEELLETLRTMKERDVVKKARLEAQKIARRNTRSRDKKEDLVSNLEDESWAPGDVAAETPSFGAVPAYPSIEDNQDQQLENANNTHSDVSTWTTDDGTGTADGSVGPPEAQGSFEQATTVDRDAAASAAADWAIERSLAELNAKSLAGLRQQDSP